MPASSKAVCEACGGHRLVTDGHPLNPNSKDYPCPACGGTGEVEVPKEEEVPYVVD